ncbi:MAG: cytidylate kinase-like family protein [Clostridiales bacterium]|nr:cytidylate kinase-like family protein [Clostridiales bacterium]
MNKIITIGRELGSGGRELGKRIAEKLGYAYYDNEIISGIAEKTDLAESYVKQIVEKNPVANFPITIGHSFYPPMNFNMDQTTNIYVQQSNIITEMADKSDCVIVGRCADFILRERNPFRIFVYASPKSRIERCRQKASENEDVSDRQLWRNIRRVDKHRAKYYLFYTGRKWGDKMNYDLCINTTNANIKTVAEAVVKLIEIEQR